MSTILCSGLPHLLNKLNDKCPGNWTVIQEVDDYGDTTYTIKQPNGIRIPASSMREVISILGECLEVVNTDDLEWCIK